MSIISERRREHRVVESECKEQKERSNGFGFSSNAKNENFPIKKEGGLARNKISGMNLRAEWADASRIVTKSFENYNKKFK